MDLFEPISEEQLDLALQLKGLVQDVVQVRREDGKGPLHLAGSPCPKRARHAYSTYKSVVHILIDSMRQWRTLLLHAIGGTYRTWHATSGPSAAAF
jgi:hypothetical protein